MRWQKHINVIFVEIFMSEIEKDTTGWNSEKQMAMDLSKVTMVTTYVLIVRALSSI